MIDANETRDDTTNRRTNVHHVHYDPGGDATPTATLVTGIADLDDADPLELEPLYGTIDPDTLDEFVGSDQLPDVSGIIAFTYEGYEVTVHASGLFEIVPVE